ncbi:hypothetical protein KQH54_03865 [bacterium]|nr:hypothetical protein [bacterium]
MFTVALIGGDGAGKTTIANKLEASPDMSFQTIYMGLSTQSSNFSLPTSKLVYFFKKRKYNKEVQSTGEKPADKIPAYYYENKPKKRSFLWVTARFFNRLAEITYRHWITWRQIRKGTVVIFDRHFLFESTPDIGDSHRSKSDQIYFWLLNRLFSKPDITILLDAPAEVLYARKEESTLEHLNRRREAYIEAGKKLKHFYIVDATQSPEKVYSDVYQHIVEFQSNTNSTRSHRASLVN